MSSEALERAERIRENISHVARGCRSASSHNPAPYLNAIEAALVALLAEVERLEQERDEKAEASDDWYAAFAVARERGQRAVEALAGIAGRKHAPASALREYARAALVDEPAAATLVEPESREAVSLRSQQRLKPAGPPPGSASAAADEPKPPYALDNYIVGKSTVTYGDLRRAAADEPGETP